MRRTFGAPPPTPEDIERGRPITEFDRTLAAFDDGAIVGTAGVISYQMTVPGRVLPAAGVTRVTVLPTHRRRGVLTAMMRRQLDDVHERGEPLAALYASEAPIYGRFGYGLATYSADIEIDRGRSAFIRELPPGGKLTLVDAETAVSQFSTIWDRVRPGQPGMLDESQVFWRFELADPEHRREGASEHHRVVYQRNGEPEGFALYRLKPNWNEGQPDGTLLLQTLIAATPEAYAALWRYCLDVDLMARLSASMRPPEEPLRFFLADARAARLKVSDGIWVRLVEVDQALKGRSYATPGRLVLDVRDTFCSWNNGRYQLAVEAGRATCTRTAAAPDLELGVADLAAVYLAGNRFSMLQQAGRIREVTPGSVARADAMFRTDRAPWCPSHF